MTSEDAKTETVAKPPRKGLKWGSAALIVIAMGVPLAATIGGAVTSPPTRGVPEGHLIHLEANTPSEHTSTLRELISVGPDGKWHLLIREHEPQSVDAGSRDWISMPTVSPDGTQIAFIDQKITLQEEEQSDFWELWVLPVDPKTQASGAGRLVADLSKAKLDEVRGLTWSPDGKSIVLASKGKIYSFDAATGKQTPYFEDASAPTDPKYGIPVDARWPVFASNGSLFFLGKDKGVERPVSIYEEDGGTTAGPDLSLQSSSIRVMTSFDPASAFAVSADGGKIAYVPVDTQHQIAVEQVESPRAIPGATAKPTMLKAKYGWSLFGGRHVSALHWSPSGRYLGYSVTKPPGGEDELFYLDTVTQACYKLPYRSGQASWTWAP